MNTRSQIPWPRKAVYSVLVALAFFALLHGASEVFRARVRAHSRRQVEAQASPAAATAAEPTQEFPQYMTLDPKDCQIEPPCNIKGFRYADLKINSLGFKGEEFQVAKPPGTFRIACMGGSTTFGYLRSLDYPSALQRLLDDYVRQSGKTTKFEVVNAGLVGIPSGHMVRRFEVEVLPLDVDLVLVGPEWNDVGGCLIIDGSTNVTLKRYFVGMADDKDVAALGAWYAKHVGDFRARRSAWKERLHGALEDTGVRLERRFPILAMARGAGKRSGEGPEDKDRRDLVYEPIGQRSIMDDFDPTYFRENIYRLIRLAREKGVRLIALTTTPDDFEDYGAPGVPANCYVFFELNDWYSYDRRVLNPLIRRIAREEGLILVDLERDFDRIPSRKDFFAGQFMHSNHLGFEVEGRSLFEAFRPYLVDLP